MLRILRMWLFSQQDHGLAVKVPPNLEDSTVILPLYISVELIHVYHIETLPLSPSWNLTVGFLS